MELFIPTVLTLLSPATLLPSSSRNPSLSPISNVFRTTSSKVVVKTLLVESHPLTVPVCVVRVFPAVKVPDTSFNVKLARNVIAGTAL